MKAGELEAALRKRLGRPLDQLTPREGIAAMCSFYADERVDGAAVENDRDMLLYQWGVDTFNAPDVFQLSITRQINVTGDSQPYQLGLIFSFSPTDDLRKIDIGNQWCRSPGDLPAFRQFVDLSGALKTVADARPDRIDLQLERLG
jgi:hypothetical protein